MVVQRAVGKCSPSGISKIYEDASPKRKLLLEASVFGGIFRMPKGVGFVGDVIDAMLSFWVEKNHFRIGKRDVYLRKIDIALILGLSVVEPKKYTPTIKLSEKETIRYKYFRGVTSGKIIRSNIETVLRIAESDDDFLKLAFLFVLCTFLFPGSHYQVSEEHVQLVDAIQNFNETPWGLFVYSDLMEYIEKGATSRKNAEKDKAIKPYNVYGCMCVLQWWAYEMLPSISPDRKDLVDPYPRLLKWGGREQTRSKGYTQGRMLESKIFAPLEPSSPELKIPLIMDCQRSRTPDVGGKRKVVDEEFKKAVEVDLRPKKKRNYIPVKVFEEDEFVDQTTSEDNSSQEEVPVPSDRPRTRQATKKSASAHTSTSNEVLLRRVDEMELENLKLNQKVEMLIEENKQLSLQTKSIFLEVQKSNNAIRLVRNDQKQIIELLQTILELTPKVHLMDDEKLMKGDKLILRGLMFHGFHGVHSEEKKLGQKFVVDVDAWLDLLEAGKSDCISDSVSYTDIYRIVREVIEGPSQNLIESVAHLIANTTLLEFPRISAVRVRVGKPHVAVHGSIDYLGVEIVRYSKDLIRP